MSDKGWAETPGGGLLGRLIADAFGRAAQRDLDNEPCATCGGDRLRADFVNPERCHAPMARENKS